MGYGAPLPTPARGRYGVLALPPAAALELDALGGEAPSRVALPRGTWTAAGLYIPAFARRCWREDELSLKIRRSKVSRERDRELTDRLVEAVVRAFPGLARATSSSPSRSARAKRTASGTAAPGSQGGSELLTAAGRSGRRASSLATASWRAASAGSAAPGALPPTIAFAARRCC